MATAHASAIFLERNLAVVLPQEVQEALVVARLHVEEPRDDLVVAARLLEALAAPPRARSRA